LPHAVARREDSDRILAGRKFGPNGRRGASVFMKGNDHGRMGLVDFNGLNNASIIFRAMNNACRLSHIQPSGTRHLNTSS
jgi:hypothetical protein